jgi:hypothetical protein
MVEPIEEMAPGTIGFRASGELTREGYREVLEPALRTAVEAGEVRMLFVVEDGFEMDAGALMEDAKTGLQLGLGHLSAWKRSAVVTDVSWVARAIKAFGFMAPGEVKVWPLADLDEARRWVAG